MRKRCGTWSVAGAVWALAAGAGRPAQAQQAQAQQAQQAQAQARQASSLQQRFDAAIEHDDAAAAKAALVAATKVPLKLHYGNDTLSWAVQHNGLPMLKVLLDAGVQRNVSLRTLLELAFAGNNDDWKGKADLLIAKGATVTGRDEDGGSPLFCASSDTGAPQRDKVAYLLAKGADANAVNPGGNTALSQALTLAPDAIGLLAAVTDLTRLDSDGKSLLYRATQRSEWVGPDEDQGMVQTLLAVGRNPNIQNDDGMTALHLEAQAPGPVMKAMLDAGADANLRDYRGDTPLNLALIRRWLGRPTSPSDGTVVIQRFGWSSIDSDAISSSWKKGSLAPLIAKTDLSAKDSFGLTPLLLADLGRDQEARDLILSHHPKENVTTQFFDAVAQGDLAAVQRLVTQQPDLVTLRLSDGTTPLHVAAKWGTTKVAAFLIAQGAEVDARDANGTTPLLAALAHPDGEFLPRAREMERLLLSKGADVSVLNAANDSPLGNATRSDDGNVTVVPSLGAGAELQAGTSGGTSLSRALTTYSGRWKETADHLLANGAEVNGADAQGTTPLMAMLGLGIDNPADKVAYLVAKGADVNARDARGDTVLDEAVARSSDLFKLLLPKADLKALDGSGRSLLFLAAQKSQGDDVAMLLAAGLDPNIRNKDGMTAMHLAAQTPGPIMEALLNAGANPNLHDYHGDTPLNLALWRRWPARTLTQSHPGLAYRFGEQPGEVRRACRGRCRWVRSSTCAT